MANRYAEKIRRRKEKLRLRKNTENNTQPNDKRFYSFIYWGMLFFICLLGIFLYISFRYDSLSEWTIQITILTSVLFLLSIYIIPKIYVQTLQIKSDNSFDQQKEKLKLEDDSRKTVAQIIGGIVLIGGLVFTYNTFRLQQDLYRLQQEGQVTDRFTKAVEQIGDDKLEVRLGGLYALERIAKDSPKDHSTVMEILVAYVRARQRKGETIVKGNKNNSDIKAQKPQTDIQTVFTIIGRRKTEQDSRMDLINLSDLNLVGADLSGANLAKANLTRAELTDANLREADFGAANLTGTNLSRVDLSTKIMGLPLTMTGSLVRAHTISTVSLWRANLSGADLRKADLSGADLTETFLMGADLSGANLSRAHVVHSFLWTDLSGTNLTEVKGLTFELIKESIISDETVLPDNLQNRKKDLLNYSRKNIEKREKYIMQLN